MAGVLVPEEYNTRISRRECNFSVEIPESMELSEAEIKEAISLAQNEIIDVISGERAKMLATSAAPKTKTKTVPRVRQWQARLKRDF